MDQELDVSIIIPTIGRSSLGRALASVRNMSSIVIADGCQLPNKIKADHVLSGKWGNGMGPRNAGIFQAQTSWCGFLDDDDVLDPNYKNEFEKAVTENPSKDIHIFKMEFASNLTPGRKRGEILWKEPIFRRGNVGISFVIRTELAKANPFPRPRPAEDFFFLRQFPQSSMNFVDVVTYYVKPD